MARVRYKARVVSDWVSDAEGNVPSLAAVLAAYPHSLNDITHSQNVAQEPNANTWELWDRTENGDAIQAAIDAGYLVTSTEEMPEEDDAA